MEPRITAKELMDRRAFVNLAVVEQGDDVSAQMAQDVFEKPADHLAVNVGVKQVAVQSQEAARRADRNPRDGRDPVMPVDVAMDGRLAARTPRLTHRRDQQEARFIEEENMGSQPCGVFFTRGHAVRVHRAMPSSSRSIARRSGFWWLQPSSWRSFPT